MPAILTALRRAVRRRHRLLATGLAAAAMALAIEAVAPDPRPGASMLVARHDLAGGTPLGDGDVRIVQAPPDLVPAGALTSPDDVGARILAAPLRRGEPVLDVRLLGPGLLAAAGDGIVAAPVRLADREVAALLRPGDRVDVLASPTGAFGGSDPLPVAAATDETGAASAPAQGPQADPGTVPPADPGSTPAVAVAVAVAVAEGAVVLAVPRTDGDVVVGDGSLAVLGVSPATARVLAGAATTSALSVVIRGP